MRPGWGAWLALLLFAPACQGARSTEFGTYLGVNLCHNGMDDDGDGKVDCKDSDCFSEPFCRKEASVQAAASDAGLDAALTADASGPAKGNGDAGSGPDAAQSVLVEDAGVNSPTDAGTPLFVDAASLPPPCTPTCQSDEVCKDGACAKAAVTAPGQYSLTVLSAIVPDESFTSMCFDVGCLNPLSFVPYGLCPCHVDPYVIVFRIRGGSETRIGATTPAMDTYMPKYSDAGFTLELEAGDALRFEVRDADSTPTDDLLFSCKPDLSTVMTGAFTCTTFAGPLGAQIVSVNAMLEGR